MVVAPVGYSVGQALGAPGDLPVSVRLVGWLRDHGAGGVVDAVENWWYQHNPPPATVDPAQLPTVTGAPAPGTGPGALRSAPNGTPLPGETVWVPSTRRVAGAAPLYTTFFRPLPRSPGALVGVAWMNQSLVHTHLIAGTQDPHPPPPPPGPADQPRAVDGGDGQVPADSRTALLATFNSGFKLKDAQGGYYVQGRTVEPLRAGAASFAVDDRGRVTLGEWGRDLDMNPHLVSVRQNLALVVDHGRPVPGLADNATGAWGTPNNQFQYTWRSGLGLDRAGNLVYVAADHITLADLARAMTAAGAVRGMQLDMHPSLVSFLSYRPDQSLAGVGTKLLPAMEPPASRYLHPSGRDFLAVTVSGR